ncbi:MAG: ActS/PrrB/RegB family redox-sensitive histidine kinase [Alphaproteobacteria bacterium]|nr:ActS/PrrB/RegB family redox-sensitive histidine kinase [Alphaproteobacteria bacterium]
MATDLTARTLAVAKDGVDPAGRIRLRTLVLIRWVAILGQGGTLLGVHYGLGLSLPILPALATVAASAALNLAVSIGKPPGTRLSVAAAGLHLAYDILQLTVLLVLTGGLENPFAIMILAPVIVSATVLPRGSTITLGVLTAGCLTFMSFIHLPVPLGEPFRPPVLYLAGIWEALILAILFISIYVGSVSEEARQMSDALAATQMALAREQRLSAVGALAAAAAHELGSPLSTIAVTARELKRDLPDGSPWIEDVELILSQNDRCRDILAELAQHSDSPEGAGFGRLPVTGLIEAAAEPHRDGQISLVIDCAPELGPTEGEDKPAAEPILGPGPEIIHGLGNLIQNAVQHARRQAVVTGRWSVEQISVRITDDGPGFANAVRDRLGEPYVSHDAGRRDREGQHMGLGIFIAQTLLRRSGARVEFGDNAGGGAEVTVVWDREALENAD